MGRGSGGKVQPGAENKTCPSFRDGPQDQTSDVQEHIRGSRFARPGMTNED
jgi:hypothetical protein